MDTTEKGALYVVATPIGNLGDISPRAVEVLGSLAVIAAEDTRHSRRLLDHYGIGTPLTAVHEHNEDAVAGGLVQRMLAGESVALISDAGTPLISDPGYRLVRQARERGVRVIPLPGPCAAIAALSASGLPTDRWVFEGFLPSRPAARRKRLESLHAESRTLVFYESSHRILAALEDLCSVFGPRREAVVARELTKTFETITHGPLVELVEMTLQDADQRKGEFVVVVAGAPRPEGEDETEARRVLAILLRELSVKKAAGVAAELTGMRRNRLYEIGLELKRE